VITTHVLDGAFERVNRAGEHLVNLNARLEAFRQEHENSVVLQFNAESPHHPEFVSYISASMKIPILIGEIVYNLRSALDYLIFELGKFDSGETQNRTQFPIEDTKNGFRGCRKTFLKGVNSDHVARIEGLQPYA
jgi:hypothetical protein